MMNQQKEDKNSFKLQDELEVNSNEKDILSFRLSSNIIKIPFFQLFKYSEVIQEEYINNHIIAYLLGNLEIFQKQGHIKEENIKLFFKLLQDEEIQISSDQYCDFCQLSELFKVNSLQKFLIKYAKQHSDDINFIINLMINQKTIETDSLSSNDKYSNEMENILINNVDKCLKNQNFNKLPISTIYRIIENSTHEISSDLLFDFIFDSISERYSLFNFLNIYNLSNSKFNEMCNKYTNGSIPKEYFQYLPNNLMYIKELRDSKQYLEKNILELKKENTKFQNQIRELTNENEQAQKLVKNLEDDKSKLQNQIDNLLENNGRLHANADKSDEKIKVLQHQIVNLKEIENEKNQLQNKHEKILVRLEELEKANINSYFEVIKSFISYILDIDKNRYAKKNILHYACELNNFDVVKYIISLKKIRIDSPDFYGKTILDICCELGYFDLVKYLISLNSFDLVKSYNCNTILHYGCKSGNLELVKYILSLNKIDVCSKNNSEETILHCGCESGNLDLVKFIISLNKIDINSIDKNGKTILHSSCESGNFDLVKFILSLDKIDINSKCKYYHSNFYYYMKNFEYYNKDDKMRYESENSFEEKTALHLAIEKNNIEIVRILLTNSNIDVNSRFFSNYEKYDSNSGWMKIQTTVEKTGLQIAIEDDNIEIAKLLLSNDKIDVNSKFILIEKYFSRKDKCDWEKTLEKTALHISIEKKNDEIIRNLLIKDSIDVNIKYLKTSVSSEGKDKEIEEKDALYMAIDNNNIDIVTLLLSKPKINVNTKYLYQRDDHTNSHGCGKKIEIPALYLAVQCNKCEIVEHLLLMKNIYVNDKYNFYEYGYRYDDMSSSPLHLAVKNKNIKIIKLLMEHKNINKNIYNSAGKRPIDLTDDPEIKSLIDKS